jgi:hypothetical protein
VPMGRAHPEIGDKSSGASAICMPCIKSMDFWWGQQFELTGSLWQSPCPLNPRWQSHTVRSWQGSKRSSCDWRVHQILAWNALGRCCWAKCPGKEKSMAKQKCSHDTFMCCKECSATTGCSIYLVNGNKGGEVVTCHVAYHKCNQNKAFSLGKCVWGWYFGVFWVSQYYYFFKLIQQSMCHKTYRGLSQGA